MAKNRSWYIYIHVLLINNLLLTLLLQVSLVIDTGNPRVFSGIPGPGPVEYLYPLWGYGYSPWVGQAYPGVYPYPYLRRVTRRYALTVE
jgi:hypothetical protein